VPVPASLSVNGRSYRLPPCPVAVICIDGCGDEYLDAALARRKMETLERMARDGYRGLARGALPSFTNTNNGSIVTGAPPSVHGISGNFFLDPKTGEEVMMNSSRYLRAPTILAAAARAGRKVAMVTAKDKLRDILSHGLAGISFSAEKAREAEPRTHGIGRVEELVGEETPPIYSAEASLFVLKAGAALLERGLADFLYLSLTDYIQHKHGPTDPAALEFNAGIDRELARILRAGAQLGITADHGMNQKQDAAGRPNVLYLETLLQREFGEGVRVVLPITDPYVLHHGSLGSLAMVHLADAGRAELLARRLLEEAGITEVHDRATAARKLELPADRIGDLVVLSGRDVVLGRRPEHHDLKAVESGLRSHGGRYEEMVPFILSFPLEGDFARRAAGDVRNFDIFDFTMNGRG
jgi:phosphonoacetate hydrolase